MENKTENLSALEELSKKLQRDVARISTGERQTTETKTTINTLNFVRKLIADIYNHNDKEQRKELIIKAHYEGQDSGLNDSGYACNEIAEQYYLTNYENK